MNDVIYYINGIEFSTFGVYVSASEGVTSKLSLKESLKTEWSDYHGCVIDLSKPRYKERTITLDCFIEAAGYDDFISRYRSFVSEFEKKGTQRLKIDVGIKPLVYEVYCSDTINISKQWNPSYMAGTFKVKLIENEPVKKILRHIGSPENPLASITATSTKLLNIYWGDGSHTFDVSGTNKTITHTYEQHGEYEIIVTGVIEEIKLFNTNCQIVWDKLQ